MKFNAFWIEKSDDGVTQSVIERNVDDLPEGDVLIDVAYSSLNYKDGLSATGAPGVTRNYPHTPGIDASGRVAESSDSKFAVSCFKSKATASPPWRRDQLSCARSSIKRPRAECTHGKTGVRDD